MSAIPDGAARTEGIEVGHLSAAFMLAAQADDGSVGTEAGLSRIYGGVHMRIDHEAGLELGHDVAAFVLDEAASSGFVPRSS